MKNSQIMGLIIVIHIAPNLSSGARTFWATVALIAMIIYIIKEQQ